MRILHISTRLILGGSQENTVLSCEGQSRLGHEVHLAFGPIYGPEGSLLARVEAFNTRCASGEESTRANTACRAIATHVVPDLIRAIHPLRDFRCLGQLRDLITRLKPDIVHTHSSKAGILGRAAAWRANESLSPRAGIVHTIHGPPFHDYQPRPVSWLYVLSERFAAKRCHAIVSVADAMTREYLKRAIGIPDQYSTVRSGMETGAFLNPARGESRDEVRRELGLAADDFVVATVARLADLKGHDDLLEALHDDLRANPSWKLLWVGDGWRREKLLARARALGLSIRELDRPGPRDTPAQLLVTGLVPPERVPALIRAADVLAHPSYREGLPRTVPQALLCGVCPVAYDVDGTGEVCRDMRTGRLVKPGSRSDLRAAIRWCFEEPMNRRALAERGRDECRAAFSAEAMVGGLERVYAAAISAARGS